MRNTSVDPSLSLTHSLFSIVDIILPSEYISVRFVTLMFCKCYLGLELLHRLGPRAYTTTI